MTDRVTSSEMLEIEKETKKLLEDFSNKLAKLSSMEVDVVAEIEGRDEKGVLSFDKDFRSIFFSNAPKKENDLIYAEKGDWKW